MQKYEFVQALLGFSYQIKVKAGTFSLTHQLKTGLTVKDVV